jgi:hypothetical protein
VLLTCSGSRITPPSGRSGTTATSGGAAGRPMARHASRTAAAKAASVATQVPMSSGTRQRLRRVLLRAASSETAVGSERSKARALGMKSNADQIRMDAWLARSTSSQVRTTGCDQVMMRAVRSATSKPMCAVSRRPGGKYYASRLNKIGTARPGWVDDAKFVKSATETDERKRAHQSGGCDREGGHGVPSASGEAGRAPERTHRYTNLVRAKGSRSLISSPM